MPSDSTADVTPTGASAGGSAAPLSGQPIDRRTPSIPTSQADSTGKPYSEANKYVMHFDKGRTLPVEGFWSLTMYDAGYFFVENR